LQNELIVSAEIAEAGQILGKVNVQLHIEYGQFGQMLKSFRFVVAKFCTTKCLQIIEL
jgi:hypothetical protein